MKRILFAVLSVLLCTSAFAQQARIVGRVIDANQKEPLIGVRVTFDDEFIPDSLKPVLKLKGAISKLTGDFEITDVPAGAHVLRFSQAGYQDAYVEFTAVTAVTDTLYAQMEKQVSADDVTVTAISTVRTVEDLCCRVEALNAELINVAPFTPTMDQVMRRYSTCTSYHINCTTDHSQTVRLRGLPDTYTLSLIDGAPLISGLSAPYALQMLPALATENVRIIEGASTSVYGNHAIAGVLSFDLKTPVKESAFLQTNFTAIPSTEQGYLHPIDVTGGYETKGEDIGLALVGSYNTHPKEAIKGTRYWKPGHERYSGFGRVTANVGENSSLDLSTLASAGSRKAEIGEISSEGVLDQAAMTENSKTLWTNNVLRFRTQIGDLTQATVTGGHSYFESVIDGGSHHSVQLDGISNVSFAQLLTATGHGMHYVTAGAEYRDERVRKNAGPMDIGHRFGIASVFAEDQWSFADQWTLLAGGRFDRHSLAGSAFSPRGAISWRPTSTLRMRVMAGQGIKGEATFNEDHRIVHSIYGFKFNPDFTYEKSLTLNYDMTYSYIISDIIAGEVNFNAYHTTISGRATPQADSLANGMIYFVNNPNPARLMGIEIQTRPTFGEHWSGSLATSLINLTQSNSAGSYERIPLSPTINVDASIMYNLNEEGFAIETWGSMIGKQRLPDNSSGVTSSPMFVLLNLRAQKRFGMFTLHAGATNLLDVHQLNTMPLSFEVRHGTYNTTIGWGPLEGREVFAGVRVDIY